jgi:hypothetical protein
MAQYMLAEFYKTGRENGVGLNTSASFEHMYRAAEMVRVLCVAVVVNHLASL